MVSLLSENAVCHVRFGAIRSVLEQVESLEDDMKANIDSNRLNIHESGGLSG